MISYQPLRMSAKWETLPFVEKEDMDDLIVVLPRSITVSGGSDNDEDALEWWMRHERDLPSREKLTRRMA